MASSTLLLCDIALKKYSSSSLYDFLSNVGESFKKLTTNFQDILACDATHMGPCGRPIPLESTPWLTTQGGDKNTCWQ